MKHLYKSIFFVFWGIFFFVSVPVVSAETSPDACVTWNTSCAGNTVTAALSWKILAQDDINVYRANCTLQGAVTYRVAIVGLGEVNVGTATSYNWTNLAPNTSYTWKVTSYYQCSNPNYYGNIATSLYSFTTPDCSRTLTVSKSGSGAGTITSNPSGINCGADCSETYSFGTSVTLTASPSAGSVFSGWSGSCSGMGVCVVSMTAARSVTASFTLNTYTLTVSKSGSGAGTVTSAPAGINCGSDCSETYNYGTAVTLTAAPSAGSGFAGWSGAGCSGTGTCTVTMTAARSVTATFTFLNQPPNKPTIPGAGETWNHCTFLGKSIPTFSWTYSDPDGDPQAAYEIEVDENAAFAAPKFNHIVNSAATSYVLDLYQDDENPDDLPSSMQDYELNWNSTYFWRVKVKDIYGAWSEWSNSDEFMTPQQAYPYAGFSWDPLDPVQKEAVFFNPNEAGADEYRWTVNEDTGTGYQFVDGTDILTEEPHIQFLTTTNTIKLRVTEDSYYCEREEDLTVELPLPEYREIPPIIWLRKIFAGLAELFVRF